MYLHVKPTGSRLWYFRYYFCGKEIRIALGV
ncbi:Arm DNA-binding domain-containing protein [Pectobacterium sp. CHL-2024]